jgi:hypothetical protein
MPITDRFLELEVKFDAKNVDELEFLKWGILRKPVKYISAACPDIYYEQNGNVIRHRRSEGPGTLTVKKRKSMTSIINRVEVDLAIDHETMTHDDVEQFLLVSGWKEAFTIYKDCVGVFFYEEDGASITLSRYSVKKLNLKTKKCGKSFTFIECEIEKGSAISDESAAILLEKWRKELMEVFDLEVPVNISIYELFSGGKKYKKG